MKTSGRMKNLLIVDKIGQKMLAYKEYMSVYVPKKERPEPLGSRPTNFDHVAQMLSACSLAGSVGGRQVLGNPENTWAEVAAVSYREFPITDWQIAHINNFRKALFHSCQN